MPLKPSFPEAEQSLFPQPLTACALYCEHVGHLLPLLQFIHGVFCIGAARTGCDSLDVVLKYKKIFLNIRKKNLNSNSG